MLYRSVLPGLRAPIYLIAGVTGVPFRIFFGLDGFAALISVPIWIFMGNWFGQNLDEALEFAKEAHIYLIIGVIVLISGYILYKRNSKPSDQSNDK